MNQRLGFILCILGMFGCASGPVTPETKKAASLCGKRVDYFLGSIRVTSPDGKIPYGPPKPVLIKRVVEPQKGRITEYSWHGKDARVSTFNRRNASWVFDVADTKKTFKGTISFEGNSWCLHRWTYAIGLGPKGQLQGKGWMDKGTMFTDKLFVDPTGKATARIHEELKPIARSQYAIENVKRINAKLKKVF